MGIADFFSWFLSSLCELSETEGVTLTILNLLLLLLQKFHRNQISGTQKLRGSSCTRVRMIRDIPAGGSRISLMVGKQSHVLFAFPTPPNYSFFWSSFRIKSVGSWQLHWPHLVQDAWNAVAELWKGKWVPCSHNHQSDLLCFSFFLLFPLFLKVKVSWPILT